MILVYISPCIFGSFLKTPCVHSLEIVEFYDPEKVQKKANICSGRVKRSHTRCGQEIRALLSSERAKINVTPRPHSQWQARVVPCLPYYRPRRALWANTEWPKVKIKYKETEN